MEIKVETETLNCVWETLQETPVHSQSVLAEKLFKKNLDKGWIFLSDVEDILYYLDKRLYDHRIHHTIFYKPFGVILEDIAFKPKRISHSASLYEGLRPEYFVLLLIQLERMGFLTDPERFVKILLPTIEIKSKKILSSPELEIFWFKKLQYKSGDVILYNKDPLLYSEPIERFKTSNGFKFSIFHDLEENGNSKMIQIRAPKFREKTKPIFTKCEVCGYGWYKGDPESSYHHRKEHRRRLTWLKPEPMPKMLIEIQEQGLKAEYVNFESALWKHNEMYIRALAFKREFGYDFIQWDKYGCEDHNTQGHLLIGERGEIVGACAFRNRQQKDNSFKWCLEWVWICPSERGKGHLTNRWSMLRERYGDFHVEPPVSDAMKGFLNKHGHSPILIF